MTTPDTPIDVAVTWDYRCPYARNAHEHVVEALRGGAPWQVRYVAFSLGQVHVAEGEPDIWDRPGDDSGLLALQAGVVVRDRWPDRFGDVHLALFGVRHDRGEHLADEDTLRATLKDLDIDADQVFAAVESGEALASVRADHQAVARDHHVWGVPTFIVGDAAAFVRILDRPAGNAEHARRTIDRVLDLLTDAPTLNEFKHTSIPR